MRLFWTFDDENYDSKNQKIRLLNDGLYLMCVPNLSGFSNPTGFYPRFLFTTYYICTFQFILKNICRHSGE
jgi:hypothetical protein